MCRVECPPRAIPTGNAHLLHLSMDGGGADSPSGADFLLDRVLDGVISGPDSGLPTLNEGSMEMMDRATGRRLRSILVLAGTLGLAAPARAVTRFVATTGNDGGGNTCT